MDFLAVWEKALDIIAQEVNPTSFETWVKAARPLGMINGNAYFEVPNTFARDWLENRYAELIKSTLESILNEDVQVHFLLPEETSNLAHLFEKKITSARNFNDEYNFNPLNPKYTFDTFVVGNSNRFAHAAALAVAESPAKAYNPLFVYGGVGLGKTHLMQAIGHFVLERNPSMKVAYVSSETFTNELINSIRDDKTVEFRNKYRNIDVLLIDDIQFLAGKERTQEEFFHTFNALHEANKQIVISSDRPPKEIPTLEDRLRSRFEWGLITDIQPPDFETRVAILKKKASLENLEVPNDVLEYIADNIQSNIRELEGALTRVMAFANLTRSPIDMNTAVEALKDILPARKPRQVTIELIQKVVAEYYHLRVEDLKAKKRTRSVAYPRQIAMYLCRELTDHSLPQIGEEFGGRDHTTVIHAHEKIAADMKEDSSLKYIIDELKRKILNS